MPEYRRWRQAGGTYFFTVNLRDRRQAWLVEYIACLRRAVANVRAARPFEINAAVVLPDHLHMVWTLPADDHDFSTKWRLIKSRFSKVVESHDSIGASEHSKGERGVWQRRFFEHLIRDQEDLEAHIDYIHFNPVKHGCVKRPIDWPHSSIHQFVRRGILDADWGTRGGVPDMDLD